MSTNTGIVPQPAQQREMGQALEVQIAAAQAAAKARTQIEARIVHATQRPRNQLDCRKLLLDECEDPGFAEIALYRKPVGRVKNPESGNWEQSYAVDFSIRFVETALQIWGNTDVDAEVVTDDIKGVTMRVTVWDVERNLTFRSEAFVDRNVERRTLPKGRVPRGTRDNNFGETVFLLEATADEMRNKCGSERSKLIRDWGKRILPRKFLVEARAKVEETLLNDAAQAPDVARRKLLDAFGSLGIMPSVLQEYLEMPIETLRPKDFVDLRAIFNGLRDGDFTWPEVVQMKKAAAEGDNPQDAAKPGSRPGGKTKDRIMNAAREAQEPLPGTEPEKGA